MKLGVFAVCGLLIFCVLVPAVGIAVCGLIFVLQLSLMCLRPVIARLPRSVVRAREAFETPVFSIHVATYAEPPEMVIRTLQALLNQQWSADDYQIIVMDNNTCDEHLWQPVEAFCLKHSDQIEFIHRTGVHGAKAGALNIALEHTRSDASHIVTVDADYIVRPDFLSTAASALRRTGADYVQFPQSYVGAADNASGVDAELEEYFRSNAVVADDAEAVLLTGTLCVISRAALVAAGGWSGATTTEDAEMGVRLCNAGFAGRFINQVVGQGFLPFSLADLEKQRYRWCSGNLQTFLKHFLTAFGFNSHLSLHKRLVVISQLTAWFNLALVPTVILLLGVTVYAEPSVLTALAAGAIVLSFLDVVLRIAMRGVRGDFGLGLTIRALACRLALAPQSAKATFDAALGQEFKFVVTSKVAIQGSEARKSLAALVPSFHVVLFVVSMLGLLVANPAHPLVVAALLILMLPLPAAVMTDRSLRAYRTDISENRIEDMS